MKKSEKSVFSFNAFQMRFCVLDLGAAQFKVASAPNKKFKIVPFRDIKSVDVKHLGVDPTANKDFLYTFQIVCTTRKYNMGTPDAETREMWISAMSVLFEFRLMQNEKQKLIHGIPLGSKVSIPQQVEKKS